MVDAPQTNPLRELGRLGQSVWLDDIRRSWVEDGTLARLIAEDGLSGVTSNPAILAKAIETGPEYQRDITKLAREGCAAGQIYEHLALADVRAAADLLRPVYESTNGGDGFVSLEVSPHLWDDTQGTVEEARRLWRAFDRPNAMIKVPGTRAGLPAIRTLIAEGVNINVTLLFSLTRYQEVVDAFLSGLEDRLEAGGALDHVSSVASFFISRIDTLVDAKLDQTNSDQARELRGRAAIAAGRLAYVAFQEWRASNRWKRLVSRGAQPQRLLWASTSTKDPAYPDTKYVEALIGPATVNTMTRATLDAYREKGQPRVRVTIDLEQARSDLRALKAFAIDLEELSQTLERDGVRKFIEPFDALHATLARMARQAVTG